jgi:hypothetical protein
MYTPPSRSHEAAEHAGGRVHHHRLLDVGEVALLVGERGGGAQGHQRAQSVEQAHQEQRQQHRNEVRLQDAEEVEVQAMGERL